MAGDPQFSSSGFCLLVSKAFLFVRASAGVNGVNGVNGFGALLRRLQAPNWYIVLLCNTSSHHYPEKVLDF